MVMNKKLILLFSFLLVFSVFVIANIPGVDFFGGSAVSDSDGLALEAEFNIDITRYTAEKNVEADGTTGGRNVYVPLKTEAEWNSFVANHDVHYVTLTDIGGGGEPPTAPTGVSCNAISSTEIQINWNAVTGADGYKVFRCSGVCNPSIEVNQLPGTSWLNSGLGPGSIYSYRVRAYDSSGNGPYSSTVTCTTDAGSCTALTCSDHVGLASFNNDFNCGLNLNDGCGGTIDCIDTCGDNYVCSRISPIGYEEDECKYGSMNNCDVVAEGVVKGYCMQDFGCQPVIDHVDEPERGRQYCFGSEDGVYRDPYQPLCLSGLVFAAPVYQVYKYNDNCYGKPVTASGLSSCDSLEWWHIGGYDEFYPISYHPDISNAQFYAKYSSVNGDFEVYSCTSGSTDPPPSNPCVPGCERGYVCQNGTCVVSGESSGDSDMIVGP